MAIDTTNLFNLIDRVQTAAKGGYKLGGVSEQTFEKLKSGAPKLAIDTWEGTSVQKLSEAYAFLRNGSEQEQRIWSNLVVQETKAKMDALGAGDDPFGFCEIPELDATPPAVEAGFQVNPAVDGKAAGALTWHLGNLQATLAEAGDKDGEVAAILTKLYARTSQLAGQAGPMSAKDLGQPVQQALDALAGARAGATRAERAAIDAAVAAIETTVGAPEAPPAAAPVAAPVAAPAAAPAAAAAPAPAPASTFDDDLGKVRDKIALLSYRTENAYVVGALWKPLVQACDDLVAPLQVANQGGGKVATELKGLRAYMEANCTELFVPKSELFAAELGKRVDNLVALRAGASPEERKAIDGMIDKLGDLTGAKLTAIPASAPAPIPTFTPAPQGPNALEQVGGWFQGVGSSIATWWADNAEANRQAELKTHMDAIEVLKRLGGE